MKDEWTKVINDKNLITSENEELNQDLKYKIQEIIKLKNQLKELTEKYNKINLENNISKNNINILSKDLEENINLNKILKEEMEKIKKYM
jgi:hypothetical protein